MVVTEPVEIPTRETVSFLCLHIPVGGHVLEVGCGEGHAAAELNRRGYRLTAVDADAESVAEAQARGVSAIVGAWPKFSWPEQFDAIAFTRSLHHISPLPEAIERAYELLKPGGLLLVEDFSFGEVSEPTLRWFAERLGCNAARRLIRSVEGQLVTQLLSSTDLMDTWERHHSHQMHSVEIMCQAIGERFGPYEIARVPYLYRYLIPVVPRTSEAAAFVNEVFEEENATAKRGDIAFLGRRVIAQR